MPDIIRYISRCTFPHLQTTITYIKRFLKQLYTNSTIYFRATENEKIYVFEFHVMKIVVKKEIENYNSRLYEFIFIIIRVRVRNYKRTYAS